jgi:transglutaminase-like putative cysteine protease
MAARTAAVKGRGAHIVAPAEAPNMVCCPSLKRLAVLSVLACGFALAASAMAGESAPPKDLAAGEDAVLLEESLEIDVLSPTSARVLYHNRTQVLTQRGAERYDSDGVSYRPGVSVRDLRGAVVSPSGKRVEVKRQMIADRALFASYALYADSMIRTISFPGVVPGSIVEYQWEQEVTNLQFLPDEFDLQERIPVRMKTLTVRSPADFLVHLGVRGALRPESATEENRGTVTQRFTVRDVPPLRREDDMPPVPDLVPHIVIRPKEIVWGGHHIDVSAWAGVGRFYADIARDRMVPAPEVAEAARQLTTALTDPDARLRAVYEYVQGKINYVSVSLDIGGWQPHPNGDVFRLRYGDCKDKATLMIAMLRSIGMTAYPVLIGTRDDGLPDLDSPGLTFNHAIVAVPQPDGYLFLDPTATDAPFGDLPWTDQGVPVLVVKDDGSSDIVETPLLPAARNLRRHSVTATIRPDGSLEGTYVIEAWGQRRQQMWDLVESRTTDRADALEELVAWLCPGAVLKDHQVKTPAGPSDPLRIEMQFEVPHYVTQAGALQVFSPYLVRFPAITRMAAYPSRLHPVFFRFLMDERVEIRLTLPPGRSVRKLPTDHALEGPGVTGSTRYEMARDGDRQILVVHRELTVSRREIPLSDYPQFRGFVSALSEEEAGATTLVPAG